MIKIRALIAKIDYLKNNKFIALSDSHKKFLSEKKFELTDDSKKGTLDLSNLNGQIDEIAKVYLGLDELEKWFPEKTTKPESGKRQPPSSAR